MDATLTLTFDIPEWNRFGIKFMQMFGPKLKKFALKKKKKKSKTFPVILWRNGHSDIYTVWKHRLRLPDCSNSRSGAYKSIPSPPPCEYIMTAGQNRTLILELHLWSQQKVRLSLPTRVIWVWFQVSREFQTPRCCLRMSEEKTLHCAPDKQQGDKLKALGNENVKNERRSDSWLLCWNKKGV